MQPADRFRSDEVGDGQQYPADLYRPNSFAPLWPSVAAVDAAAIAFYREHGYLAVADVFSDQDVATALEALSDLVGGRNESYNEVYLEAAARADLPPELVLDQVRKLFRFVQFDERLNHLAHHSNVLDIGARLLGRQLRLFQDMALLKPPQIGREKPWHQDHAYFDLELSEEVVGVWIALDEATVENGCMQFLDGGHKQGPMLHWKRRDWQICDSDMQGRHSVACPLHPGGAVFFSSLLPHGTPQNNSADRRRALQFHYCAVDAKATSTETRLAVFGSEGKDVSC